MHSEETLIAFLIIGLLGFLPVATFCLIRSIKKRVDLLQENFLKFRRDQEYRFTALLEKLDGVKTEKRETVPPPPSPSTATEGDVNPQSLVHQPIPPTLPVASSTPEDECPKPPPANLETRPPLPYPEPSPVQPSPVELLLERLGDWLAVKGDYATKGTTREFAFVTRWLTRIGTVLLIGCILYFMKLSVDRGWVGPASRTISVIVGGTAFAILGAWMIRKTRYAQVGHAFTGLGFIGMYLGFGLGHRFFHPPVIESAAFAFCALTVVTILAGAFSVYLPSAGVAVLALLGGYLVPAIAGTDSGNPTRLYLYLILLNCAAAYVAHRRKWSALNFLAATGAFILSGYWQMRHGEAAKGIFLLSFGFGTVVHLLYLVATVAGTKARGKAGNALAWTGLALNAAWYLHWICYTLHPILADETTALIFLVCVAVYVLLAHVALKRGWADHVTVQLILLFAFAYLAFALYLMVALPNLVPAWCLIAAVAGEAAKRTGQPILGRVGLVLLVSACVLSLWHFASPAYHWGEAFDLLPKTEYWKSFALRLFRFACVPLTLAAFAWRRWCPAKNNELAKVLWCISIAIAFIHLTAESRLFGAALLPSLKDGSVTLAWAFVSAGSLVAGIMGRLKTVRLIALALLGLAVLKLLLVDTTFLETPWRVLTFGLTGIVLFAGALVYLKFKERFENHEA